MYATDTEDEVEGRIQALSHDEQVGGIVLQLPLPKRFNRDAALARIDPKKDVDNLTGRAMVEAPTVGVVKEILREVGYAIVDYETIAVVGRGFLVGQPIIAWLKKESSNHPQSSLHVKVADIETVDLRQFLQDADLVITGVGKAGLIQPEWLKAGASVIDFGFPPDFNAEGLALGDSRLAFYTPTPGGTGPILVAKLFENFYTLINAII